MEKREAEPTQEELFTGRYLKLVDEHQSLQQIHARTWAENERRKLELEELGAAMVAVMRNMGVEEFTVREARPDHQFRLERVAPKRGEQAVVYRIVRKLES